MKLVFYFKTGHLQSVCFKKIDRLTQNANSVEDLEKDKIYVVNYVSQSENSYKFLILIITNDSWCQFENDTGAAVPHAVKNYSNKFASIPNFMEVCVCVYVWVCDV